MKRIFFLIVILFLFSGIALGTELGAGDGTGYPAAIDTDTSVEVDYPDPLATTARAAVPNDTNAAVIAMETELGISPSGAYDTVRARLDAGDGLYYLKTEIDTKFTELKFIDLADTPAVYDNGKYAKSTADGVVWDTPAGGASTFLELTDTPADYTGKAGEILRVNDPPDAVEFSGIAIETTLTVDSDAKVPTSKAVNDFCETTKGYLTTEVDPTVDTDAKIKAILVDEVTKIGDFTSGKNVIVSNASGIIQQGTNTDAEIEVAVTRSHVRNEDTKLQLYNALISNYDYSGLEDVQPVSETVVIGDLLSFNWTNKKWQKTDADLANAMPGLRIAFENKSDGQDCKMLVMGYIRVDAWDFTGAMVYASATAGEVTSTAPSTAGQQLQRVGVAKSADILFFDPSIDVGEI